MTAFLIVYVSTALMVSGIIFMTTLDVFPLMNKATKITSILMEILVGIFWFPVLIYITVWTALKKIRSNNLQS